MNLSEAVVAVSSNLEGIFTLKEEEKNDTEGFSQWTHCFVLPLTGLGKC